MPPKKKKKGKKKKGKKEYDPPVYQIPTYDDPELVTPRVDLVIRNGTVNIPDDVMTLRLNLLITKTIGDVASAICKHHQGSVNNILICKDRFEPTEVLPATNTLEMCGITGGQAKLFYDFAPITYPLLG